VRPRARARVDDARYCFHHPAGSDPELGRACDCRKPAPGLILQAADDLGLDRRALERSWLIGDSDVDVAAGRAAGLRTVVVEHPPSAHRRGGIVADARAADVLEAARIVVAAVPAPIPAEEAR
jgi:D-glycero-D-manno-heptose 1,7-bisphosphate phosphatase